MACDCKDCKNYEKKESEVERLAESLYSQSYPEERNIVSFKGNVLEIIYINIAKYIMGCLDKTYNQILIDNPNYHDNKIETKMIYYDSFREELKKKLIGE